MMDRGAVSSFSTAIAREMLIGHHHLGDAVKRPKPGRQELVDFYLRHQEAIQYAEHHLHCPKSAVALGYIGAVIARAFYSVNRLTLDHFAEVLATGYSKEGDESIIRLRNHILRVRIERKRGLDLRDDIYSKTEKTLKDWLGDVLYRSLTGVKEEAFLLPEEQVEPKLGD